MIKYLTMGVILGLSAGFAPGPLFTLVISETLRNNIKAGLKVAIVPILTDIPIIIITLFVLARLSHFQNILGIISLVGGAFVFYMGIENIRHKVLKLKHKEGNPNSLIKGIVANVLSPHPYLFWFSVGGPTISQATSVHLAAPYAFIGGFYALLVGSKIFIAVLTNKSRSFLQGKFYLYIIRFLGIVLCILALVLFYDGIKLLVKT